MSIPLKALLIDDNEDDALLIIANLEQGGYNPDYKIIYTADALRHLLDTERWDVVLADFDMGQFTGLDALRITQEKGLDLPFIVVSGTIGEDVAVETMKAGAHDYLMKGNLARLAPAVQREIAEAKNRRAKRQAEKDKEQLLRVLEQRNSELQSIVHISSHDLRSPLINIKGFSSELESACRSLKGLVETSDQALGSQIKAIFEKDIQVSLDFIKLSADKMYKLVEGLLSFSRVGIKTPTIEQIHMNDVIQSILGTMSYQIKHHEVSVEYGSLPDCVGDAVAVTQVFTNLIDNAIKYRNPERKPEIQITGTEEEDNCIYFVKDNGIGIQEEFHDVIFEIFHQLHPSDSSGGVGLGLTITKSLLNTLNGRISFQSEPGKGTTFIVTLPCAAS